MLAAAAVIWITLDADAATPKLDIGRSWTIVAVADASFKPIFVYPDFTSGAAMRLGFRMEHALRAKTAIALTAHGGASYVDDWRPRFEAGAQISFTPYPKSTALLRLADHAFNYSQYGVKGFEIMAKLIDRCDAYEFIYSRLDDAIQVFDSLLICDARTMVSS